MSCPFQFNELHLTVRQKVQIAELIDIAVVNGLSFIVNMKEEVVNMDPQWVSVGVLVVLALITGYYAYEVRLTRRATREPSLSIVTDEPTFRGDVSRLALVNSGGVARDVKIDISTGDDTRKKGFYCPALHDGNFLWLDFDINEIQKGKGKVVVELRFKDNSGNILSRSLGLDFGNLEVEDRALAIETPDRRTHLSG